jgi:hydrogenase maturation protease
LPPVLILGIGNTLLGDEGAGVHALQRLHADSGNGTVELLDAGTLGFNLLPTLEVHPRLIVIDAAELDAPPGTVRVFEGPAMDKFLARPRRSVHEVGIGDLLQMLRLGDNLPAWRALVGVQPLLIDWSEHLSPAVARSLDEMAAQVRALVARWNAQAAQAAA